MKPWIWHLPMLPALFLMLVACQSSRQESPASEITVIEGATIIDGVADTPIEDAILVIEGETIRSLARRGTFQPPANARTVNATGKTIMPGMINLHGHVGRTEGMDSLTENFTLERVQRDANVYLYYGVTHVLSLGHDLESIADFLAAQQAGRTSGARVYTAGLGFGAKGGWPNNPYVHRPTTPEEAHALARKELGKHPQVIKIWVDDREGQAPKLPPEIYGPIIEEARKAGVHVAVHAYNLEEVKDLIRRGVTFLAHSILDKEVDEEFLTLAKEKGVLVVPTLSAHDVNLAYADGAPFLDDPGLALLFPASVLEILGSQEYQGTLARDPQMDTWHRYYATAVRNTVKIAAAGIPIALGTDSGLVRRFPGLWEHREMELLVQAGLTPMQAIQAATINGAKFLGLDHDYGTLSPGKVADFLVLDADPLSDITNSRKIDSVWMNGKAVDRAAFTSGPPAPLKSAPANPARRGGGT